MSTTTGASLVENSALRGIRRAKQLSPHFIPFVDASNSGEFEVASPVKPHQRIVFINRFFYPDESATSQMLFDLTTRLVARGYDVHVVCSRQMYDNPGAELPASETIRGVQVHRILTCRFGRNRLLGRACDYVSFYLSALLALPRIIRKDDVVVAKTDPPLISVIAAAVAWMRGAKLINWLQDVFPEVASHLSGTSLPSSLSRMLKALRDMSLRSARYNVVLGKRMRTLLLDRGIAPSSIVIIENWADGDTVVPQDRATNKLRETHGWKDRFVVCYSGNLGRAHEFETIVGAAELLRESSEIIFVMIGGGHKMKQMRAECECRRLDNVEFLPYQPRETLADSLGAADVHLTCLLPQLEGLIVPSKFYGVLAAGRPAIFVGDPRGELAEAILNTGCGAVVERGDAEELKNAILRLQQNADLAAEQGRRARSSFEASYTLDTAAAKWFALLGEFKTEVTVDEPVYERGRV